MYTDISFETTMVILAAAALHASWNAALKKSGDPLNNTCLLNFGIVICCALIIPFFPLPERNAWLYILASSLVHVFYFLFLALSFNHGYQSVAYTISRAFPPIVITIIDYLFIGTKLNITSIVGVIVFVIGILFLLTNTTGISRKLIIYSIITAICTVIYTIIDGLGTMFVGNSVVYIAWLGLIQGITFIICIFSVRPKELISNIKDRWQFSIASGAVATFTYTMILHSMTKAPISLVATIRESSVLFASIIGMIFLGEQFKINRIISAILILLSITLINWE